ncbi:AAA family ATPase [Hymenobacter sp. IS2118]|uniref:AAA family ATPase n=1 Tax=Hymenobacter sp. IS2118 TaxID=1505605 RepID=UPI000554D910|nr:AAA family ATPase [Hymenobacter sp. IS2118]
MKLSIENIGPIGSAHLDLTGLTVIGGLNDSGKSTVGKSLFAIVKAIRNREDEFVAGQRNKLTAITSELISELRGAAGPAISPAVFNNTIRRVQDVRRFSGEEGLLAFDAVSDDIKATTLEEILRRIIPFRRNNPGERLPFAEDTDLQRIEYAVRGIIEKHFSRIRSIIAEKQNPKETYSASFKNIMNAIFHQEINNKRQEGKDGTIKLSENEQDIFSIAFSDNILKTEEVKIQDDVISALFEDATLLESPFVLNFQEHMILTSRSSNGDYSSAYPTYDLVEKLNYASTEVEPHNALELEITEKISKTIGGQVYFETESDGFVFSTTDDNISVNIANTASGVKTLGILQMLARAGFLNTSNLLIIDEPEVHLHPAWQILYAEIVAILVKNNVYCVVSSHSPYFIQALEAYSTIHKIEKLTKFYISDKDKDKGIYFKDVTEDTEPLYKLLADPMKEIAFLRARAQNA